MRIVTMSVIAAAAAALATTLPAAAATTVLDFNAASACAVVCTDYAPISQSYGDSATVDMSYTGRVGVGNTASNGDVNYWGAGYSGLPQVAWSGFGPSAVTEIKLQVLGNNTLTLDSFQLGSYLNVLRNIQINLFDLNYNSILSTALLVELGSGANFTGYSTNTGFILQIGPDGYNGGITNLTFSIDPVPEPSIWAMLITGFGLVGATLRRRRAVVA